MNKRLWSSLTATLLAVVFGTTVSSHAEPTKAVAPDSEGNRVAPTDSSIPTQEQATDATQQRSQTTTLTSASTPSTSQATEVVKVGEYRSQAATEDEENLIAKIHPDQRKESPAATLYVRSTPVLTFIGSRTASVGDMKTGMAGESQEESSSTAVQPEITPTSDQTKQSSTDANTTQSENGPVWRATTVAARLNQLSQNNVDAEAITVSRNAEGDSYTIKVNEEELVTMDDKTILPDTTDNLAEDALQVTNRLRRLVGNAPPLQKIAGIPVRQVSQNVLEQIGKRIIRGVASWYGPGFHGRRSASGERFNQNALTAAHRSLPFGTKVRVTNINNGRSVTVRINDRGPYSGGRVIDLSAAAAKTLGMIGSGTAPVQLEVLETR